MYSNELICNILNFIEININKKISIEEISLKFFYNRYYVMKLFKKELNISLISYVNNLRIYNSIKCIQTSNDSFTKIALLNGFYSLEYFSEIFSLIMGVSPRVFRTYINNRLLVSDDELNTISTNWIKLQTLINKINKYQKNKKPLVAPVLKYSIFK